MHISIFTGGILQKGKAIGKVIKETDVFLAADSGAKSALNLNIFPKEVIGDMDSIDVKTKKTLKDKQIQVNIFPSKKDETDTELAILHALKLGATRISVFGGTQGDRIDHIFSMLLLMITKNINLEFVNGNSRAWFAKGPKEIKVSGKKGDLLSLIPLSGNVTQISTLGLAYQLSKETLFWGESRGVSNVFEKDKVSVSFKKGIIFIVHVIK